MFAGTRTCRRIELVELYARARAFAFLSEYEGFGMTPLEALAAGVPPVVLDTPVARESCGDAALYVPRGDGSAATTRALETALFDDTARARVLAAAPAVLATIERAARGRWTIEARPIAAIDAAHADGTDERMQVPLEPVSEQPWHASRSSSFSFNARADLERCLESLHAAPPDASHEIIVVDNASTDGSAEAVRRWPDVRLVAGRRERRVRPREQHRDPREPRRIVLLLNSDTIVPPGAIDGLLERAASAARRGRRRPAAGRRRTAAPSCRSGGWFGRSTSCARSACARQRRTFVETLTRRPHEPDWVSGACLLVRRADAEAVGLLDERYFMYTEDVDFCAALRARGRAVLFTPEVRSSTCAGVRGGGADIARGSRISAAGSHSTKNTAWLGAAAELYLRMRRGAD